ncbi:MAG: protein kinase, partial [Thiotrichaceae bacterium]|nr:protein kinase [Thiotrichaceae bacterium]
MLKSQGQTKLFLAVRKDDKQKVVLKSLQETEGSANTAPNKLRTEFLLLQRFNHPGIVKALGLETVEGKQILVRDYFDGLTLDKYLLNNPLPVIDFIAIDIKLAEALSVVHHAEIIHCNLTPSNILIQPQQKSVLLIGFSRSLTNKQTSSGDIAGLSESDQNYWAPEQSGRMNRVVDYRTDIYSLGTLFYQILSGKLPFDSTDSIGLLHKHIALTALLLSDLNHEIPNVVSRIVDKMMAKNPDDRYQNLLSLIADLQVCQQALHSRQGIYDFDIGKTNNSAQLFMPGKLYGRKREIAQLIRSYNRACEGATVLTLLKGPSGIGKSRIVNAIRRQGKITTRYCLTAKFDQFKRNAPLEMLHSALRDLVRTLLSETEESVLMWRARLLTALSGSGQLIIDVI